MPILPVSAYPTSQLTFLSIDGMRFISVFKHTSIPISPQNHVSPVTSPGHGRQPGNFHPADENNPGHRQSSALSPETLSRSENGTHSKRTDSQQRNARHPIRGWYPARFRGNSPVPFADSVDVMHFNHRVELGDLQNLFDVRRRIEQLDPW